MILQIDDPERIIDRVFISKLIYRIKNKIIVSIDNKKLLKLNEYLNNNPVYKNIYNKHIDAKKIIIEAANSLQFNQNSSNYIIYINPNIYAHGLDRVKLNSLCKLINFGNVEITGYSIFTDIFKYFADNIQDYLDLYFHGLF